MCDIYCIYLFFAISKVSLPFNQTSKRLKGNQRVAIHANPNYVHTILVLLLPPFDINIATPDSILDNKCYKLWVITRLITHDSNYQVYELIWNRLGTRSCVTRLLDESRVGTPTRQSLLPCPRSKFWSRWENDVRVRLNFITFVKKMDQIFLTYLTSSVKKHSYLCQFYFSNLQSKARHVLRLKQ